MSLRKAVCMTYFKRNAKTVLLMAIELFSLCLSQQREPLGSSERHIWKSGRKQNAPNEDLNFLCLSDNDASEGKMEEQWPSEHMILPLETNNSRGSKSDVGEQCFMVLILLLDVERKWRGRPVLGLVSTLPSRCHRLIQRYTVVALVPFLMAMSRTETPATHIHTNLARSWCSVGRNTRRSRLPILLLHPLGATSICTSNINILTLLHEWSVVISWLLPVAYLQQDNISEMVWWA